MPNNLLIPTSTQITGEGPSVASILYGLDNTPILTATQKKQKRLTERTANKLDRLDMKPDTLLGMQDADSFTTSNFSSNNREDWSLNPGGYDAVEIQHQLANGTFTNPQEEANSRRFKAATQAQQVAVITGKAIDDLTPQDYIDVGNMQQIQKLSDLGRSKGEDRWTAPYIQGIEQTNLTGHYTDEFGRPIDVPLNVPILSAQNTGITSKLRSSGEQVVGKDVYGRDVVQLGNPSTLENITYLESNDPAQNAAYVNETLNSTAPFALDALTPDSKEDSFLDSVIRAPKAFIAGGGKSAYDVADTAVELTGRVAGDTIGLVNKEAGDTVDKFMDLGTGDEKTARVNSMLGYDDSHNAKAMANSAKHVAEATKDVELFSPDTWKNLKGKELWKATKDAFSSPEAAAYSLGYMGVALAGVAEKGAMKLFGKALKTHADDVAKISARKMTTERKKKYVKALEKRLPPADKVKLFLAKNADAGLYGITMNNDQMDDWVKANGGEKPTYLRIGLGATINAIGMKADMGSAKFAIKDSKDLGNAVESLFKGTTESEAGKAMAKAAEYTARLTAAGMTEFPQEYMQSYIEAFNKVYGTDDRDAIEVANDPKVRLQATQGAVAGAAGGVHMAGGSALVTDAAPAVITKGMPIVGSGLSKALDSADSVVKKVGGDTEIVSTNPDIDTTNIRTVQTEDSSIDDISAPSVSDNTGNGIEPSDDIDYRATAVVANNSATKEPLASIQDEEGDSVEVSTAAEEFDNKYTELLNALIDGANVSDKDREVAGLPSDEKEYANTFTQFTKDNILGVVEAAEKLKASGAGVNKINAATRRIEALVKIKTAQDSQDVKRILNDAGTEQAVKVRAILGSSAITPTDIDTYLKSNSDTLTPKETKLLEAKSELLKTTKMVGAEKIQGGGTLPGVNQWLALLGQDKKLDNLAKTKLTNFVNGQNSKRKSFRSSLDKWDKANKMPWTKEGSGNTSFKPNLDYTSHQVRTDARSFAINSRTMEASNNPDVVEYGDSSFDDIYSIADMVETLDKESIAMDKLNAAIHDEYTEQKQPSKAQTQSTGKSTPVEATKPPKETMADKAARGAAFKEFTQDEQQGLLESIFSKSMGKKPLTKVETVVTQDKEFGKAYEKFVVSKATNGNIVKATSNEDTATKISAVTNSGLTNTANKAIIALITGNAKISQMMLDAGIDLKDC